MRPKIDIQKEAPIVQTPNIARLDDKVINKIAAGEVVERPASVLKEFLENSIDAGAKSISIEIREGGTRTILVRDDGSGIRHNEIGLALARHATSKLNSFDDIENISTLGFRGEALPSIASVSRLTLSTRTEADSHGYQVQCAGSSVLEEPMPIQHQVGTTVEIQDLFFNVPARRKFLRSKITEKAHLTKLFKQMLLARTDIGFSIQFDGRKPIQFAVATSSDGLAKRLKYVFNEEFSENRTRVEFQSDGIKVRGWIGSPEYTRAQPDQQFLYVNGRAVHDRSIAHAVRHAYMDLLYDSSRFPAFAIFVDVDQELVDVNVHPAKTQVRFKNQSDVYRCVLRAVSGALAGEKPGTKTTTRPVFSLDPSQMDRSHQSGLSLKWKSDWTSLVDDEEKVASSARSDQEPVKQEVEAPPLGFALAQLAGAFVLAENADGLIIVDMHAAHERLTYESLKHNYEDSEVRSQVLLVPVTIKVSAEEAEATEVHSKTLLELGFEVSRSSENIIAIRAVPEILKKTDLEQLIRDVISDLMEQGSSKRVERVRNEILATMSCHGSIRANYSMSVQEMNSLLRQMESSEHSGYCSHGRPTWRQISIQELNRLFHRGR